MEKYTDVFKNKTVGLVFHHILKEAKTGITQTELCKKTELSQPTISDILKQIKKKKLINETKPSEDLRIIFYTPNKEYLIALIAYVNRTLEAIANRQPTIMMMGFADGVLLRDYFSHSENENIPKEYGSKKDVLDVQLSLTSPFTKLLIEGYLESIQTNETINAIKHYMLMKIYYQSKTRKEREKLYDEMDAPITITIADIIFNFQNYILLNYHELLNTITKQKYKKEFEKMRTYYLNESGLKIDNNFLKKIQLCKL